MGMMFRSEEKLVRYKAWVFSARDVLKCTSTSRADFDKAASQMRNFGGSIGGGGVHMTSGGKCVVGVTVGRIGFD